MTDPADTIAAFIDNAAPTDDQRAEARRALVDLRRKLHELRNKAEMTCEQEPCGDRPPK